MLSACVRALIMSVAVVLSCWTASAGAALPADTLRLHYHREGGDYDGWGLHVWGEVSLPRKVSWGQPLAASGRDSFGVYFDVPLISGAQHVGFILHQGNEKNVHQDMMVNPQSQGPEIWQLESDPTIYTSRAAAAAALPAMASDAPAKPDARQEQADAARDARAKADMLALAREADKTVQKDQQQLQDADALKQKAEQDRLQQERDKLVQQLIAQRDAAERQNQQKLYLQRQEALKQDMLRRAEQLEEESPHRQRAQHLSPLEQFLLWIGGGLGLIVLVVLVMIWRNRRLPPSTAMLNTTQIHKGQ